MILDLQEPIQRLDIVDEAIGDLRVDMKNKVTFTDLYNEMKQKASVDKVMSLEQSIVSIN